MFEIIAQIALLTLMSVMVLRKANITSSALTDNAASFVNQTARRLHIILSALKGLPETTAAAVGDSAIASLDEVPLSQAKINDSRSHIQSAVAHTTGGTGAVEMAFTNSVYRWNRNELVLDPDEALFMNIEDVLGAPDVTFSANLMYDT